MLIIIPTKTMYPKPNANPHHAINIIPNISRMFCIGNLITYLK